LINLHHLPRATDGPNGTGSFSTIERAPLRRPLWRSEKPARCAIPFAKMQRASSVAQIQKRFPIVSLLSLVAVGSFSHFQILNAAERF
jgi:hypothetical protein